MRCARIGDRPRFPGFKAGKLETVVCPILGREYQDGYRSGSQNVGIVQQPETRRKPSWRIESPSRRYAGTRPKTAHRRTGIWCTMARSPIQAQAWSWWRPLTSSASDASRTVASASAAREQAGIARILACCRNRIVKFGIEPPTPDAKLLQQAVDRGQNAGRGRAGNSGRIRGSFRTRLAHPSRSRPRGHGQDPRCVRGPDATRPAHRL